MSRSGYYGGDIADEGTLEERFLGKLYRLAEGEATWLVSGEELARELGMDLDGETDKVRFLGRRGALRKGVYDSQQDRSRGVRDYSSLSLTHAGIRAVEEGRRP